jgi:hypothetical protein
METFIEERAKLVRSLADNADPFIKRRLLMLAERYDRQLGCGPLPFQHQPFKKLPRS